MQEKGAPGTFLRNTTAIYMENELSNELLADSDFFVALYKRGDTNRERALRLLEKIRQEGKGLALSVLAFSEIATLLAQRVGKATSNHFMKDAEITSVRIIHTSEEIFEKTKQIFESQRSKNVSFTNANNIVLAGTYKFPAIVSFDKDYPKNNLPLYR